MKRSKSKTSVKLLGTMLLCASLALSGCGGTDAGNPDKVKLDPENPVTVTVWNYYNGEQLKAFNALVDEYNDTEGREKGILVEGYSQGSVTDLENSVLDSANRKVGAAEMPNIFAAYADTAYAVDQMGLVVDLTPYFTEEELNAFMDSYIEEGRFTGSDGFKIFPTAKSTEVFMLNKTDWDKFSEATDCDVSQLKTMEGLVKTAEEYYQWTDGLTAAKNDGKAFFGRDAVANYMLIGSMELGQEIFAEEEGKTVLHFDKEIARKLWDHFYVPYIKGYFDASGRFRSGDIKTGNIISFVGSSSGATFFPHEVIPNDTQAYPIEMMVLPCPGFTDGKPYAVQQGAGMVVTQSDAAEVYASIQFLKWFSEEERNVKFSVSSGYLPVKKAANDMEVINQYLKDGSDEVMQEILSVSIGTVNNNTLYTPKAFKNGTDARNVLEYSMSDKAKEERMLVKEKLDSGMSLKEAVAEYDNDENFNEWYEATKAELEALVK